MRLEAELIQQMKNLHLVEHRDVRGKFVLSRAVIHLIMVGIAATLAAQDEKSDIQDRLSKLEGEVTALATNRTLEF